MSVPIFLSYMDYCRKKHKNPTLRELHEWKMKYNHR